MTILNRPSDGQLSVLLALHRALTAYGPMSEERLLALCAPSTVVQDRKPDMAKMTLSRWKQIGFFKETGRHIAIVPQARLDPEIDLDRLRSEILKFVLAPHNNAVLGKTGERAEGDGTFAEDFTRAAAWVLSQDTYAFGGRWPAVEELLIAQGVTPRAIVNDVRWNGFVEWATFLGLGWPSSGANINLDPAAAVEWVLPKVFGKQRELRQDIFLQRVADEIPVLDGGVYRLAVQGTVERPWRSFAANEVSPSLSTALTHLEARGTISLEPRSDASAATVLGRGGKVLRRFSHVLFRSAS